MRPLAGESHPRDDPRHPRHHARMHSGVLTAQALSVDPHTGWLASTRRVPSPNCDDRPPGAVPELIVVHGISLPPGEFGGPWIDRLFTNTLPADVHPFFCTIKDAQVSAHLLVRRTGAVVQYVPVHRRAWHAGKSNYQGRERCNDFSIGIELEGDDTTPYEPIQYRHLAELICALLAWAPTLAATRIVGHSDIAPGRKTDPGPVFDWPRLHALLSHLRRAESRS